MRAAYLEHGRGIGARHPLGARRIDARPTWSAGHRLLARNPPERGHGSGAHTHRRTVHSPDVPRLLQVCTASGRSRQLRARRPLSAEAFGHGPSRARGNAVGCGRYRLQGQLRCKSTNEPVHSNIFPLRY